MITFSNSYLFPATYVSRVRLQCSRTNFQPLTALSKFHHRHRPTLHPFVRRSLHVSTPPTSSRFFYLRLPANRERNFPVCKCFLGFFESSHRQHHNVTHPKSCEPTGNGCLNCAQSFGVSHPLPPAQVDSFHNFLSFVRERTWPPPCPTYLPGNSKIRT